MDDGRTGPSGTGGGVTLRLFAALEVPVDEAERLVATGERIADGMASARVARPETLHVTFAFLGDVAEEYVPAVVAALDAAGSSVPGPTHCAITGVEPFGNGRVLGADVDVDLFAVLGAARDRFVESVAMYAPHVDRRPWRPHVSILRAGADADLAAVAASDLASGLTGDWVSSELRLFASLPGPSGRLYRVLAASGLGLAVQSR